MNDADSRSDNPSLRYWKAALGSLPPEKRDAAWEFYVNRLAEGRNGDTLGGLILLLEANAIFLERIPERYYEELIAPLQAQLGSLRQRLSEHEKHQSEIATALERTSERNVDASTRALTTSIKVEGALRDAATSIDTCAVVEKVKHQIMEGAVTPMAHAIERLVTNTSRIDEATKAARTAVETWRRVHLGETVLAGWGIGFCLLVVLLVGCLIYLERRFEDRLAQARSQLVANLKENQDALRKLSELGASLRVVPIADSDGKTRQDSFVAIVDPADNADIDTRDGHTRGIVYLKPPRRSPRF